MSVLLDDETVTIEVLNFDATCDYPRADPHSATVAIRCRHCHTTKLLCGPHLAALRRKVDATRGRSTLTCITCQATARVFEDLVEVLPL